MINKKYWKIYRIKSGDLSREISYKSVHSTRFLSIKFDTRHNTLITRSNWAGHDNICFDVQKDTRGAYKKKIAETVDCYKIKFTEYGWIYIPVNAFSENHYGSNLDMVSELPEEIVDYSTELVTEAIEPTMDALDMLVALLKKESVFKVKCPAVNTYRICNTFGDPLMIVRKEVQPTVTHNFFTIVDADGDTITAYTPANKDEIMDTLDKTIKFYDDKGFDAFAGALDNILIELALR